MYRTPENVETISWIRSRVQFCTVIGGCNRLIKSNPVFVEVAASLSGIPLEFMQSLARRPAYADYLPVPDEKCVKM